LHTQNTGRNHCQRWSKTWRRNMDCLGHEHKCHTPTHQTFTRCSKLIQHGNWTKN
jgi:hypothetical protein